MLKHEIPISMFEWFFCWKWIIIFFHSFLCFVEEGKQSPRCCPRINYKLYFPLKVRPFGHDYSEYSSENLFKVSSSNVFCMTPVYLCANVCSNDVMSSEQLQWGTNTPSITRHQHIQLGHGRDVAFKVQRDEPLRGAPLDAAVRSGH